MNIKRGVYIQYENEKEVHYLCPNCKKEIKMSSEKFYAYPYNPLLCKACCKKPHVLKQGGCVCPLPNTENDIEPVLRFYNTVDNLKRTLI